jgi:hypothetical protein
MAKANLVLPDGTKVQIEGTADEVAALLARCSSSAPVGKTPKGQQKGKKRRRSSGGGSTPKRAKGKGPVGLITELAAEGFFKTKRILPEIQKKLEEAGNIYAQTSLSPAVLGLTKKKVLRRLKEKKGWAYVRGSAEIE